MTSVPVESGGCSITVSPRLPILPPCRICGVKASGLHYGVNSCEACKGFFRRSLTSSKKYVCSQNGNCEVMPSNRNKCAFCRYQKCLKAGMSMQSIRTGRYTHEKRARDVIEVKTLEGKLKNSLSVEERQALVNSLVQGVQNCEMLSVLSTHYSLLTSHISSSICNQDENNNAAFRTQYFSQAHDQASSKASELGKSRKDLIERWSVGSNRKLLLIVLLAKSIPGFSNLPLCDQIVLLKASRAEAITIMIHKRFDWENGLLYATHSEQMMPKSELVGVYEDEILVEKMFQAAHNFQALKLTASEMLLVLAIIITFPDRVDLEAREAVEKIQNRLVSALKDCVEMNHPEERHLLARILVSLVSLRELTLRSNKAISKIQQDWSFHCNIDPFWEEFISDSHSWYDNHL